MTTKVWTFSSGSSDVLNTQIYTLKDEYAGSDWVLPDADNCEDFPGTNAFKSLYVEIHGKGITFTTQTDKSTFLDLNSVNVQSGHQTRYMLDSIIIKGDVQPTFDEHVIIGFSTFQTVIDIRLYDMFFTTNFFDHVKSTSKAYTHITKETTIDTSVGLESKPYIVRENNLVIKKEGKLTNSASNTVTLYYDNVYLAGVLSGDIRLTGNLICLTEDDKESRGLLTNATISSIDGVNVTVSKINISGVTFVGDNIVVTDIIYPNMTTLSTNKPHYEGTIYFPEGFKDTSITFADGTMLSVSGPVTNLQNQHITVQTN